MPSRWTCPNDTTICSASAARANSLDALLTLKERMPNPAAECPTAECNVIALRKARPIDAAAQVTQRAVTFPWATSRLNAPSQPIGMVGPPLPTLRFVAGMAAGSGWFGRGVRACWLPRGTELPSVRGGKAGGWVGAALTLVDDLVVGIGKPTRPQAIKALLISHALMRWLRRRAPVRRQTTAAGRGGQRRGRMG
jgi:hypothetical protein